MSGTLGGAGCAHKVDVRPQDVPSIVKRYSAHERVTLDDAHGQTIEVAPRWSPVLELTRRDCSFFDSDCEWETSPALEDVRYDGRVLYIPKSGGTAWTRPLRPEDIGTARVALPGYDPPGWRPTWGYGGGIAGATGGLALQGHWRPDRWLGLELGAFAFPGTGVLDFYTAMRVRTIEIGPFVPFLGWFLNGFGIAGGSKQDTSYGGVGPRVGLELDVMRGHLVFSVEGDLVHPVGDHGYFGEKGRWVPWGGGSVVWFP